MRRKLFTVDDAFDITGRGIVVVGELEPNYPLSKIGSPVVLVHPDGSEITTKISGIEHVKHVGIENFNPNKIGVMLRDVSKSDVPIGTEVYLKTAE